MGWAGQETTKKKYSCGHARASARRSELPLPRVANCTSVPHPLHFLQRLLPIRVFGHKRVDSKIAEFEFFLTDARMQLGNIDNKDAILASLVITQAEAWLKDEPTKRVRIDKIGAEAAVTLPRMVVDPNDATKALLDMTLQQMAFGLSTKIGNIKLCIESTDLAPIFSRAIEPLAWYLGPAKLFPECIDADIPNFSAFGPCPDGIQAKRMSIERPDRNPSLELDVTHATSRIQNGYWMISIPRPLVERQTSWHQCELFCSFQAWW